MTDDIFDFDKSPKEKFFHILCTMNKNIVEHELDEMFKRLVILEEMLEEDEELDKKVRSYEHTYPEKMEQMMQNLYLHITANMIGKHE